MFDHIDIVIVDDAGHGMAYTMDKDTYEDKVTKFLDKYRE